MHEFVSEHDPIETIERTLRDAIHDVLSGKFGPNWVDDANAGLGADWAKELHLKSSADEGVQKPEAVYDLPLAYAEFSDLGKLLEKHKALFHPVFSDWSTFLAYYRTAEKLRNIVKHHRDISPHQHALLVGIAGEIQDAAYHWRIGGRLEIKRTTLQFTDLISTKQKTDEEVIEEAIASVSQWRERSLSAVAKSPLNPDKLEEKVQSFEFLLHGQHLSVSVSTAPNAAHSYQIGDKTYKGVHCEVRFGSACKARLDDLVVAAGMPYQHVAYDLVETLDLEALKFWSTERAGLNGGSTSVNSELTAIDYSVLGGRIRVGAWKYTDMSDRCGGRLFATFDPPGGFWNAHKVIGPKQIIGFMVGSITPKAMMHLTKLATIR